MATAHTVVQVVQAGAMGAVRKDAALAALSSQLAGMQLQAGPGRRASMPEPLGGNAGGQTDPAVVQVPGPGTCIREGPPRSMMIVLWRT